MERFFSEFASWHETRIVMPMADTTDNTKVTGGKATGNVVALHARSRADALERLNRITGLQFDALPESLIDEVGGLALSQEDGEELIYRALHLWSTEEMKAGK